MELIVHHTPSNARVTWFYRISEPPRHPQEGVGCAMRYKWPWMDCHAFHVSCECMLKVLQAWDVTHTCGCPPSRQQTTKDLDQAFAGSANHQAIFSEVLDVMQCTSGHIWFATHSTCLVYMDKFLQPWNTINRLKCRPPKQHITQAVGPYFAGSAKPPWHYHDGVYCYIKPPSMDVLSPIPHVLWMHGKGVITLDHNQYNRMPSIQAT